MSYFDNAKSIENKIGEALSDEGLVYTLHTKAYPATLVISQSQSPAAQMDFLANANEGGVSSKDSALRFIFELDGIKIHTDNRLIITDAFMTKLKGLAKKWHTAYTHAFFADKIGQQSNSDDTEHTQDDTENTDFVTDDPDSVIEDSENVTEDGDFDAEDFPVDECADAIVGAIDGAEETDDGFPVDDADSDPFDDLLDEAEDAVSEDE